MNSTYNIHFIAIVEVRNFHKVDIDSELVEVLQDYRVKSNREICR